MQEKEKCVWVEAIGASFFPGGVVSFRKWKGLEMFPSTEYKTGQINSKCDSTLTPVTPPFLLSLLFFKFVTEEKLARTLTYDLETEKETK